MAGEAAQTLSNRTVLEIILEKTGKKRLNRASLRTVPVAELHEVCEVVGIEHSSLTKREMIVLLLDAGEFNVGGGINDVHARVKKEPDDGDPAHGYRGACESAPVASGRASGRALTRMCLKPAKPTRANPHRGGALKEEPGTSADPNQSNMQTLEANKAIISDNPPENMNTSAERRGHEAEDMPRVQTREENTGACAAAIRSYHESMDTADVEARDESAAAEMTPAVSTEPEGDEPESSDPQGLEMTEGAEESPQRAQEVEHACCDREEQQVAGEHARVRHDGSRAPTSPRRLADVLPDPVDASPGVEGIPVDAEIDGDAAVPKPSQDVSAPAQHGIGHSEQLIEPSADAAADGPHVIASQSVDWERICDAGTGDVERYDGDEADVKVVCAALSDTKLKVSDGSSLQQGGADGDTQVSSGAAAKRIKAPIVWQSEKDVQQPTSDGPLRGMFDQVLRASGTSGLQPLWEDPVEPYDGPRFTVTLIKASYSISRNKSRLGQPKRTVTVRKPPGRFSLSGCPGMPPADRRGPLEMSQRPARSRPNAKHWKRSSTFTGKLLPGEKAEYAKHGHCVSVRVSGLPREFWYCPALKQRFVIDPMEWDKEYYQGVQRIESSMASHPDIWLLDVIRSSISRTARATAIRQFMAPNRMGHKVPYATYYRHFTTLARGVQRKVGNVVQDDADEQAYERGCSRTVGCADGLTFDMLVALPRAVIYDVMLAFGREPCTDAIVHRAGADERLRLLITDHCPSESFDRVVCKQGQPPKVKLCPYDHKADAPAKPQLPRAPERGASHGAHGRDISPAVEPRAKGRAGVTGNDTETHQRNRARRLNPDEDLRQPRQRPLAVLGVREVANDASEVNRDRYKRSATQRDQGTGSWKVEAQRQSDHVRLGEVATRRQRPLADQDKPHAYEHSRQGSMQRENGFRNAGRRSPSRDAGSRARSSPYPARPRSRSAADREPDQHRRVQRDSAPIQDYLPPAPNRRDIVPVTEMHPASLETTAMPLVEPMYAPQGRHDAPVPAVPLAIPAASLMIPAATIQEHFQAALAKAVQDVVKSMGIVPGTVAGGVLSTAPSPMQPETYAPPSSRAHIHRPQTSMPSPQHDERTVHPKPTELASINPGLLHGRHLDMHADDRRYKRSRVPDDKLSDRPPPRAVVPRHATGALKPGTAEYTIHPEPQRERPPQSGRHECSDDGHADHYRGGSFRGWKISEPAPSPSDSRDYSPSRRRAPAKLQDRPAPDSQAYGIEGFPGAQDRSRAYGRYESGPEKGADRSGDKRKQQQKSSHPQSPTRGRPALDSEMRLRSSPGALPPPPPGNASRAATRGHEPDLSESGMGGFIRGMSRGAHVRVPGRHRDTGPRSHEATPYRPLRSSSENRPHLDQRAARREQDQDREVLADTPLIKLRSGGSRVADRRRTGANAWPGLADNEDAFAVEYNCFAIGDGNGGKETSQRAAFNSGKFTSELVTHAAGFATSQIQVFVSEQGRKLPLMGPVHVLQQASTSVRSTGAAAVLLGMLNPLSGCLSIGKVGDVGYLVLRPPGPDESSNDLKVMSVWRPYDARDHRQHFYSTQVTASTDLVSDTSAASWAHDSHFSEIRLQPSDLIIAATDGFFDVVHVFGSKGLATRQYIRDLYLESQLDPGQLAEKLLLRAWNQVQSCRNMRTEDIDTPFFTQVRRADLLGKFRFMPEDDIAVVVSYVLQA